MPPAIPNVPEIRLVKKTEAASKTRVENSIGFSVYTRGLQNQWLDGTLRERQVRQVTILTGDYLL
jgi:hypothetical protein